MKIMIMTDMEGCADTLNHGDRVMPENRFCKKGKNVY